VVTPPKNTSGTPDATFAKLNLITLMLRFPRAGSWYRFTAADWQFIMESLHLSERSRDCLATLGDDQDAVRSVVDHPKLFESVVMQRQPAQISLEFFFFITVRHTLKRIGVEALEVADYMAVVCADFGLQKTAPQNKTPQIGLYSVDYLEALDRAGSRERFFIHVECANQFLVLTCLYPDFLHHRAERKGAPDVGYYEQVVVSHLQAASRHPLAGEYDLNDVLMRLSDAFPPVRRAMNHTLREFLHIGG
jgi:hypothetical protein